MGVVLVVLAGLVDSHVRTDLAGGLLTGRVLKPLKPILVLLGVVLELVVV